MPLSHITSHHTISPHLFHSKLKTLLFNKSYPDSSSPPYLPPCLNSKHHSCLTVCIPDSLDITRCLSILFWISACDKADSRDFAIVGAVEISSLRFTILLNTSWAVQHP